MRRKVKRGENRKSQKNMPKKRKSAKKSRQWFAPFAGSHIASNT